MIHESTATLNTPEHLNVLPFKPGDRVRLYSLTACQDWRLADREGIVEEVNLFADIRECCCTVMLDVRGLHIPYDGDVLIDVVWDLLKMPPEELPDVLPIFEEELPVIAYFHQLRKVEEVPATEAESAK